MKALRQAILAIPPKTRNYWGRIAQTVPGKTAYECQAKHYESVVSSKKHAPQYTSRNASTNDAKHSRRPTAREQFSRYLQKAVENAHVSSTALGKTSGGDDFFQVRIFR